MSMGQACVQSRRFSTSGCALINYNSGLQLPREPVKWECLRRVGEYD
jgi:hypothetical protein